MKKKKSTFEKENCGSPQEGITFICSNNHWPAIILLQEGDGFFVPDVKFWCKNIVKMLLKLVSLSTVKPVLYHHGLRGHSERKKPYTQSKIKKSQVTVWKCTQELTP
ncbi:hypothetical protein AMECASPLE_025582 [Ameca splendens]|uniref:Uncharacterized protein n=1 Tax=Ameca splendens TaxID=208324 RepID=A0ABV0XHS2_9TELE